MHGRSEAEELVLSEDVAIIDLCGPQASTGLRFATLGRFFAPYRVTTTGASDGRKHGLGLSDAAASAGLSLDLA